MATITVKEDHYDPSVISDQTIIDLGQKAASNGYAETMKNKETSYNAEAGGISLRVYLYPETGIINNFHPRWLMNGPIFLIDTQNDALWIVKEFFNSIYSQRVFVKAVNAIAVRCSYTINEDYCYFSDPLCEGMAPGPGEVEFCIGDHILVVSEELCMAFMRAACEIYMKIHPEDKSKLPIQSDSA